MKQTVNGENWIISQEAAEKLKEQEKKVQVKRSFKGKELIGKTFENPITKDTFPILPGWFVDPTNSDRRRLQRSRACTIRLAGTQRPAGKARGSWRSSAWTQRLLSRLSLSPSSKLKVSASTQRLKYAAQMGIKDQNDPKADQATKDLYKKEFHGGVLKENCGPYAGKTIREVKDALIADFRKLGVADSMYDLPEPVVCRCMTQCIVKILSDQWFLNYSDPEWKA